MSTDPDTNRRRRERGESASATASARSEDVAGDQPGQETSGRTWRGRTGHEDGGHGESVPTLLRRLTSEGAELIREEVALARAEMKTKLDRYGNATRFMAIGGALLFAALLLVLWAVNMGLTALLVQWVDAGVAAWLSPLILSVVLGGVGYALVRSGRSTVEEEGLAPKMTTETLREDGRWLESRARQMKEERR